MWKVKTIEVHGMYDEGEATARMKGWSKNKERSHNKVKKKVYNKNKGQNTWQWSFDWWKWECRRRETESWATWKYLFIFLSALLGTDSLLFAVATDLDQSITRGSSGHPVWLITQGHSHLHPNTHSFTPSVQTDKHRCMQNKFVRICPFENKTKQKKPSGALKRIRSAAERQEQQEV